MPCKACVTRSKTWTGGDPICSFEQGKFSSTGWNCATANAIRDLFEHSATNIRYCDDQNYMTIKIDGIELSSGEALALWLTWYKSRGRTDEMWLLGLGFSPRRPTENDCIAILNGLEVQE